MFCNVSLMTLEYIFMIRVNSRSTLGILAGMMNPLGLLGYL